MKVPQIFDRNMKRLAFLDNAVSVGYSLEINSLWTATFTLPADDDKNAYCQPLNFVEIFDGDERIDLFRIIGEDLEAQQPARRGSMTANTSLLRSSDVLFQYHQYGGGGIKTADVLNYVLARQTTRNWGFGRLRFQAVFRVQLGKFNAACGAVRRARNALTANICGHGTRLFTRGRFRL